jgi:predicted RNase H-like nuclease (RuvC/YqgF family)
LKLTLDSHDLNPDFGDPVDVIVEVSSTETEKKIKGHEAYVKDAEEQLRGELQQSHQRGENMLATIQRLCADNQHFQAGIQRRKQVEQQAKNQAAEDNRRFTRLGMNLLRAEGEARSWLRKYEELRDLNPEAEANVIRFKEEMAAKEALMDENSRKQYVIRRFEAQLITALPLKNQFSPYIADLISVTAERDQLVEHIQALH